MKHYFYDTFPGQLRQLSFEPVTDDRRRREDPTMAFFGGRGWEHVYEDLSRIPRQDRPRFVLSLFMVVLTDQAIYRHFPDFYERWRTRTAFPKFGRSRAPARNENPLVILWAPERHSLLGSDDVIALLPEFVSFWTQETADLFRKEYPEIPIADYFAKVRNDHAWRSANQGTVVAELKRLLEAMATPFGVGA